jgi:adenylosuccinate lyase
MNDAKQYENPLIKRYASARMGFVFSPQFKFQTWRKLWILLAEAERDLACPFRKPRSRTSRPMKRTSTSKRPRSARRPSAMT